MEAPPTTENPGKSFLREAAETIVLAVVLFLLLQLVVRNFRILGASMLPTLETGQFVLVERVSYWFSEPRRGDVVIFEYPRAPQEDFIKRIIGLPGETVEIESGSVYINGNLLVEPYLAGQPTLTYRPIRLTLGPDEYFVMGDNRAASSDSRAWGPLPRHNIIGRAWLCYWPPSRWGVIRRVTYP
ncbi:MAG: signal peptidase I [Chloroflexi bacterium]|nr:signal peptidase I [Chloroflexota bacterium]